MTLLLKNTDIKGLLSPQELIPELKDGFEKYSIMRNIDGQRANSPLPNDYSSSMIIFPGLLNEIPAYTVKVHAKFQNQSPSIKGVIHLHDLNNGDLLSIMDSPYLTAVRTGLSGALGTHILSHSNASRVTIIGCGVQGELQLRSLTYFRSISKVYAFDLIPEKARLFADKMRTELNIPVFASESLEEVTKQAEIIISATWSEEPFLFPKMIQPGTHITTLGADQPGKCEISAELIQQSVFICDDIDLSEKMGAIGGAGLTRKDVDPYELGEVLAGYRSGRTSPEEITVFGSVGLAFQDLVVAWNVYQKAIEKGIGESFDFNL
ncbi:ornithine cyclodeaminase family protein [Bacillus sp. JJ1532]|uniref:ornithine cyclodeaminase family protein n=1 Tax=unclassified Bacillus (in: firmicutes) TaxID=185979 RepID=UPI002FFD7647